MGITIYFKGQLENNNMIHTFIEDLTDIAETLNWEYEVLDEDWSKPSTAKLSQIKNGIEITGHLSLKGICINLHPDCESLMFYFNSKGILTTPISTILVNEKQIKKENAYNSVKTQFAPPDIHITIIKLLKFLKRRYIHDLNVVDEGEYWESEDKKKLIKKLNQINDAMNRIEKILSDLDVEHIQQCSSEQLAKILEDRLKEDLKNERSAGTTPERT